MAVPASLDLLTYYRKRIDEFENERDVFLKKFSEVEETGKEIDRLKWELKVREDEVMELQKALSDANVFLFDEREQVLRLQAENDALKVQEVENRRRIQHLLALTQPVTQEVTFFRDCRPEKVTKYPEGGPRELSSLAAAAAASGSPAPPSDGKSGRVLRTVYLPSERADALLLTVQSLQQQLDESRHLMDQRTEAWRTDREEREKIHGRKAEADAALIATLEKDLAATKDKLLGTTQEYLGSRHGSQAAQRQLREQAAALQAANAKLMQELSDSRESAQAEVDRIKAAAKRESQQFREYARQQAQQREDDLRLLKEQYAEVQAMYETRVKALEGKVGKVRQRYRTLERRRNLELEGFNNDVAALRRAVLQLEGQYAAMGEYVATTSKLGTSSVTMPSSSSASLSKSRTEASYRHVRSSGYGAPPSRRKPGRKTGRRRPTAASPPSPDALPLPAHDYDDLASDEGSVDGPGNKQALAAARVRRGVEDIAARVAALRDETAVASFMSES